MPGGRNCPGADSKRTKSSMANLTGPRKFRQIPSSYRPSDRRRPTNRLGENALDSLGKHKTENLETVARFPNNTIRRFKLENESETSRAFRLDSLRHGPMGNLPEQTLQQAKRPRPPTRSDRKKRWRTGPDLGSYGKFRRAFDRAIATARRIASGRLHTIRSANIKR